MTYEEADKLKESFKDNSTLTHYPYCKVRENIYIVPFSQKDRETYLKEWLKLDNENRDIPDSLAKYYSQDNLYDVLLIYNDPHKVNYLHQEWADTLNKVHKK